MIQFYCMKIVAGIIAKGKSTRAIEYVGNALLKTAKLLPFATIPVDDRDETQGLLN